MQFTRAVCSLVVALALPTAATAIAARGYLDSPAQVVASFCPSGDQVAATASTAGYFADLEESFPRIGDVTHVRAIAMNISGCLNDVAEFDFFLPEGGEFAVSTENPVICTRGRLDGTFEEPVPTSSVSSCLQTPIIGPNGGADFGFSALPFGWFLKIEVPVVFRTKLDGSAGPMTHRLTVVTTSNFGLMAPVQPVTTFEPLLR